VRLVTESLNQAVHAQYEFAAVLQIPKQLNGCNEDGTSALRIREPRGSRDVAASRTDKRARSQLGERPHSRRTHHA
jgi:hypothetical protein